MQHGLYYREHVHTLLITTRAPRRRAHVCLSLLGRTTRTLGFACCCDCCLRRACKAPLLGCSSSSEAAAFRSGLRHGNAHLPTVQATEAGFILAWDGRRDGMCMDEQVHLR